MSWTPLGVDMSGSPTLWSQEVSKLKLYGLKIKFNTKNKLR
jgi:hypothetical protein